MPNKNEIVWDDDIVWDDELDLSRQEPTVSEKLKTGADVSASLASGFGREAIAGLAGLAKLASDSRLDAEMYGRDPNKAPEEAERTAESVRNAIPQYVPGSERSQQALTGLATAISGPAEKFDNVKRSFGDSIFDATDSPGLATAAYMAPDITLEVVGATLPAVMSRVGTTTKTAIRSAKASRMLTKASPTIDDLFKASSTLFKEIDDAGVVINGNAFAKTIVELDAALRKAGMAEEVTTKSLGAMKSVYKTIEEAANTPGNGIPLSELDRLRNVAKGVYKSADSTESALGKQIMDTIDNFIDSSDSSVLTSNTGATGPEVAAKYKVARNLWGRGRRSELIENAFERAAIGGKFENQIRSEFKRLLKNKSTAKMWNADEKEAMVRVINGDVKTNIAKVISIFGLPEVGGKPFWTLVGIGGGSAIAGPAGAVAVPLIGQMSGRLAKRLTTGHGEFANAIIRAGKDGRKVAEAYLVNTPRAERSATELAELLMRTGADIKNLPKTMLVDKALKLMKNEGALASAAFVEEMANIPKQVNQNLLNSLSPDDLVRSHINENDLAKSH